MRLEDLLLPLPLVLAGIGTAVACVMACVCTWCALRVLKFAARPAQHAMLLTAVLLLLAAPLVVVLASERSLWTIRANQRAPRTAPGAVLAADVDGATADAHKAAKNAGGPQRMANRVRGRMPPDLNPGPRTVGHAPVLDQVRPYRERFLESDGEPSPLPASVDAESSPSHSPETRATPAVRSAWQVYGSAFIYLWLGGLLAGAARLAHGCLRVRRLRQTCVPSANRELQGLAAQAAQAAGLGKTPELYESRTAPMPLSYGFFRPAIVLPHFVVRDFGPGELEAILLHEAAHIARRDVRMGLLQRIIGVSYWWNPLIHWINGRLTEIREEICDNYVVRVQGHGRTFARMLVKVAEGISSTDPMPATVGLWESRGLERRIAALADRDRDLSIRVGRRSIPVIGLFGAVAVASMFVVGIQTEELQAQRRSQDAAPSPSAADANDDVVTLTYEQMDEVLQTLRMLEEKTRANAARIKTWTARGTFLREERHAAGNDADPSLLIRRGGELQFAYDQESDSILSAWIESEPAVQVELATGATAHLTNERIRQISVLTPEHWLRFAATEPFEINNAKVVFEKPTRVVRDVSRRSADQARRSHEIFDPREAFLNATRVTGNREYVWDHFKFLQQWPRFLEEAETDQRRQSLREYVRIEREPLPEGDVITVHVRYIGGGRITLKSIKLAERFGFNPVEIKSTDGDGKVDERLTAEYVERAGVFVPSAIMFEGHLNGQTLDSYSFADIEVNGEIPPGTFSYNALDLFEGELVVDEIRDRQLIFQNGELVEVERGNSSEPASSPPHVSTQLRPQSFTADHWNTLVRKFVDLRDERLRFQRGEVAVDDPNGFLAQHRSNHEALAQQLVQLAEQPAISDMTAYMALDTVVTNDLAGPAAERAAELLISDHVHREQFRNICRKLGFSLPPSLAAEEVLRGAIENSRDREVVALASLSLARFLRLRAQEVKLLAALPGRADKIRAEYGDYRLDKLRAMDAGAMEREAEALLARVMGEFADVQRFGGDSTLQDEARRERTRLLHLSIGRQAQEIDGEDIHGNRIQLSDHHGKVRVLLFWGDWCGPCRKGYPLYRELTERYAGRPFAFLGINSDKDKAKLADLIEREEVTWPCWWDGHADPWPIHDRWALYGAPWIFVLDAQGRIRFTDVRPAELEQAVEILMAEL